MVAIFVIAMIITCILIEYFRTRKAVRPVEATKPAAAERFVIPRGFFVSKAHAWVELLTDGDVRIGADDFVQKLIGSVDGIEAPTLNTTVKKGEPLFNVKKGNHILHFTSPVSGTVVEVNETVAKNPGAINRDPYVAGWVAVVEPTNIGSELRLMSVADEATKWLRNEIARFRNFIREQAAHMLGEEQYATVGVTLLDGGLPMTGVLEKTDEQTWKAFERTFLRDQN